MEWVLWLAFASGEMEPMRVASFESEERCLEVGGRVAIASGMAAEGTSDKLIAALAATLKPECRKAN